MWTCTGKRQPGNLTSPFNHAPNAHTTERLAALIDEHVGRFNAISLLPVAGA
jgi:hypothetical protein